MKTLDFITDFPQLLTYDEATQTVVVGHYWIRDFYTLVQQLDAKYPAWQHLHVYAQRTDFDFHNHAQFGIDLSDRCTFRLFTQVFTLAGTGKFLVSSFEADAGKQATFCVQQVSSELPLRVVVAPTDAQTTVVELPAATTGNALHYTVALGEHPVAADLVLPTDWAVGDAFYWVLNQTFQEAFACFSTDPDQAAAMFRWVAFATDGRRWANDPNAEMQGLGWLAASMAARAMRPATLHYVPQLDLAQYRQGVAAAAQAATPIEQAFTAFIDQAADLNEHKKQARLFQQAVAGQLADLESQISALKGQRGKTVADLQTNLNLLHAQQQTMLEAQERLRLAVEHKAVKDFFIALFALVGSLGAIVASGNPTAAAGAAESAQAALETAKQANAVTDLLTKLKKIIDALKNVADFAFACDIIRKRVDDADKTESGADVNTHPTNGTDWLSDLEWQVLRERWDGEIRPFIDETGLKVPASDYMTAGRIFVLYGQAVTASRMAVSQFDEQLAQLQVQRKTLQQQAANLDAYMQAETEDAQQYYQVALLLRQRYFYVKRFLLVQINSFREAFTYWALSSLANQDGGLTNLGYGSAISEMATVLVNVAGIMQAALGAFPGAPQGLKYQVVQPLSAADRDTLRQGNAVTIPINPLDPAFCGYDRLRVQYVRVLLPGLAAANADKTYYAIVQDNGNYQDRLNGACWSFQAEVPMLKGYSAGVAEAQRLLDAESILRGNYAHSAEVANQTGTDLTSGAYYTPTLFTTWSISLPSHDADNAALALADAEAVVLQLFGTAIFNQQALAATEAA